MSNIAQLVDPEVVDKMQRLAADVKANQPARILKARHAGEPDIRITKASTEPNLPKRPRLLTQADAIDIDPRSGALIETSCVDCEATFEVDPQAFDPDFFGDENSLYFPLCTRDAQIRALWKQRDIEMRRRATLTTPTPSKEQDMDLDNMADAEIGATVRQQLKAEKAEKIKANKPKVEAERRKADKKAKKGTKAKQAERKQVFPAFTVGTSLEVPALDLTDVPSLDEAPSAVERSPYNKARFRLAKELPLDPEATTYRTLMAEHVRLHDLEAERVINKLKAEGAKPKKTKTPKTVVVADVKATDDAKVKALAKVLGVSKKEARKTLDAVSR